MSRGARGQMEHELEVWAGFDAGPPFSWPIVSGRSAPTLFNFPLPGDRVGDCAMTLDKRPCALIFASFLCFAAAHGGSAGAAEVYPGCAQPGPMGKIWYLDP